MSQNNSRKEPTFGDNANTDKNSHSTSANAEQAAKEKLSFSLHSSKAPGYTFTPVMKRPADSATTLSSMEEQAMINKNESQTTETKNTDAVKPAKSAGFTFAPVAEDSHVVNNNIVEATAEVEPKAEVKVETKTETPKPETQTVTEQPAMKTNDIERVIPTQPQPEPKASVIDRVPPQYRRLFIVGGLGVALLLVFFLLKPSTPETVEELQQQGTSLPIEFRPVDEAEAKRAEEEAKALQEKAQQEAQLLQAQQQAAQQQAAQQQQAVQQQVAQQQVAQQQADQLAQTAQNQVEQVVQTAQTVTITPTTQTGAEVVAVAVKQPEVRPNTGNNSVIYQPETEKKAEKAKPALQPKAETKTIQAQPKPKAEPTRTTSAAGAVSSKTMTVPKGVSLMQVFRDNGLNIADVNAMNKVNSMISRLKEGEKVTVRLDKNNRVTEMTIGSGGRFIRQTDGSYVFK
ncbi:LysM-like peptidoglycan-binding domain-containing protein [Glaesserella sp.]|uniref:LysM-like peptidoglycan-binding domain-containing protein n=1 Tax=Glaesserella sp. TaxID=2094731 RepID=UPI0035A0A3A1